MEPSEFVTVVLLAISTVSFAVYGAWWYFFGSNDEEE